MIRRFFCHNHKPTNFVGTQPVQKGTVTLIRPKEVITNEGLPFCVNCRYCFIDVNTNDKAYICKKISTYDVVTGNKNYETCEKQRKVTIGSCGPEGKWFSENLWIDV